MDRQMKLTGIIKKEGSLFSSLCLELDVASCGETYQEALDGLIRAIEEYLDYMKNVKGEKNIYRPVPIDGLREFLSIKNGNILN